MRAGWDEVGGRWARRRGHRHELQLARSPIPGRRDDGLPAVNHVEHHDMEVLEVKMPCHVA
jgi:hypothetical protein